MLKRFLFALSLTIPAIGAAQPSDSLVRVLDRFNNGAAIQVNDARGHFFGVKNGAIVFEGRSSVQDIPLSDVNALWKQKSHARTGMITGAIIGAIPVAAIGAFLVSVVCEDSDSHCRGDYPIVIAYGAAIGGAGGGLIGGLIGYAVKKWVRVY
jgi:membrane associated rhomboid family serine protease